ncbi:MAG TPA: hypothetical protein VGK54_13930 [Chloroflexota bacterium]
MGKKARKPTTAPAEEAVASGGMELPERWSVQRKTELVLRLLRGAPGRGLAGQPDPCPRTGELEAGVPGYRHAGLKTRAEPEECELTLPRAKIGELMMRLELAEHLIGHFGFRAFDRLTRS